MKQPNNISLGIGIDGVSWFKNPQCKMWPVTACILNLPPSLRFKANNMLLLGMWVHRQDPYIPAYLKPFLAEWKKAYEEGISIVLSDGQAINCKVQVIYWSLDLKAKWTLQEIKSGGYHCCPCCKAVGERPEKQVYFDYSNTKGSTLRTNSNTYTEATSDAVTAITSSLEVTPFVM